MNDQIEIPIEDDDDEALTLARYAERAYLDYAVSVVKGRALPDVCDGQKPVQRRILYAMNEMGLGPGAKPVKSARVVGDVLGKFHPHGDTAAYDALVRMAQSFTLRYPLIDGHGNFGSRDGDSAAAMRYTEARLTPYARLLLDEIDQGTVDFIANYDGSTKEPRLLPARLPMLLLNGASGIAVGMATEIPPHNLREIAAAAVAVLKDPKIDSASLAQIVPGPDFPGGGQIISSTDDIREIYETGRGSIKMRGRHIIEDLARGQWQLVVTELPQGVSAQRVLEEIEELTNPKVRAGKKSLTPEQLQLKSNVLAVLDTVRDESGKEAPVRLVFEPKTSKIDSDELLRVLRAHTSLETGVAVNLVTIGLDGRPRQKNLATILAEWCEFRVDTVTRRSRHRLGQVDDRIHILGGRQLVLLRIDEVIRIIRESDEPKPALIDAFGLTDRQAEDILEIRLRQLARLEAIRIEKELASLRDEREKLDALLKSPVKMRRQVIQEIEADAKQYGDDRRTLIEAAERTTLELRVPEEPVTVIVSQKGWVRARQGHDPDYDPAQAGFKTGDAFYGAFEVMTTDNLYAIDTTGRVFTIGVSQLPSARGDGVPVTSFVELEPGARIEHVFAAPADTGVLLSTRGGYGLICQASDLVGRTRQGKSFVAVEPGDAPARPALFVPGMDRVLCVSRAGHALVFDLAEVKALRNGGRGVTMLKVDASDSMQQAIVFGREGVRVQGTGRGGKAVERMLSGTVLEAWRGTRARKGRYLEPRVAGATLSLPKSPPQGS